MRPEPGTTIRACRLLGEAPEEEIFLLERKSRERSYLPKKRKELTQCSHAIRQTGIPTEVGRAEGMG
jgi:hypothetical protein